MSDSTNSDKRESLRTWLGVDRGPIALAFTDIVGSTEMAISNGDRLWIDLLMEHFKKARYYKELNGGYEVKLIGDACMVAFRTADAALEFAMAFAKDTGHREISIRAGIHVGEVRIVENDIYGVMVNYTFRVQHAMRHSGIALSTQAKLRIEHEWGRNMRGLDIIPLKPEEPLRGFPEDQQVLWQIRTHVTSPIIGHQRPLSNDSPGHVADSAIDFLGSYKVAQSAESVAISAGAAASVAGSKAESASLRIEAVSEYLDPVLELMHFDFDDVGKDERGKYVRVGKDFTGEIFQAAILDFRLKPVRGAVPWVEVLAHILFKDRKNRVTRVGAGIWHGRDQPKVPMRPGETQSLILTGAYLSSKSHFNTYEHGPRGDEDQRIERMLDDDEVRVCVGLIAEYMNIPRSDNTWYFKLSKTAPDPRPKMELIKPNDFEKNLRRSTQKQKRSTSHQDPTVIIKQLSDFIQEGNQFLIENREKLSPDWPNAKNWAARAEVYISDCIAPVSAAYFSMEGTPYLYPGGAISREYVNWVHTRIERLGKIASELRHKPNH